MGTKYTSQSASGYNATPPADDGTQSDANKVKWSTIKGKLTDPTKTLADNINSQVNTALDYGPVSVVSAAVTLGASHNNQFIELSGAATPTLDSSDGLGAGWFCDVKNVGTQAITMARERTNDTIDGVTADVTINPLDYIRFVVNAAANGFYTVGVKKATAAQVAAGTASDGFITPETLAGAIATQAEVNSLSDGYKYITPSTLGGFVGRGALYYGTSTVASDGTGVFVRWANQVYDTDSIHSGSDANFVVPSGVSLIRVSANVSISGYTRNITAADDSVGALAAIYKGGSSGTPGLPHQEIAPTGSGLAVARTNLASAIVQVTGGDTFSVYVYQNSGSNLGITDTSAQHIWFSMEIIK